MLIAIKVNMRQEIGQPKSDYIGDEAPMTLIPLYVGGAALILTCITYIMYK